MADTVQHKRELLCSQVQGVVSSFYLYLSFLFSLFLPSFNLLLYGNCNPIGCHVQQLGLVIGDKNGTERHNRLPCYSALRQVTMLPRAVQQVCCLSLFLYTPVCVCVCDTFGACFAAAAAIFVYWPKQTSVSCGQHLQTRPSGRTHPSWDIYSVQQL